MRLVFAVVGRDDLAPLLMALAREGYIATVFPNVLGLLQTDAGLMIGVPALKVPALLTTIRSVCRPRPRPALPLVPGLTGVPPYESTGGAVCVVLKVERFERFEG